MSDDLNARFRTAVTPHNAVKVWGLADNAKGYPISTHSNIGLVLDHMPELLRGAYYDAFHDQMFMDGRPMRDADDTGLCMWMQEHLGMSGVTPPMVRLVVAYRLLQAPRHSVREYLDALVWDGIARIAHAFEDAWGAETSAQQPCDYLRAVSRNFFLGLVARVRSPGCQFDNMVVFEGAQGIGKSKALRALGGAHYRLVSDSVMNKDFFQALRGVWLIEIGEMDSFSRGERERIKVAISTPEDWYRSSYGHHPQLHPRQCVFAGTTNREDYLTDDTGGRRFWPVKCGLPDAPLILATRDQWFAEASHELADGRRWWETPPSTAAVQSDRYADDVWTSTVAAWVIGKSDATSTEILLGALKFRDQDMDRVAQNRVGAIMRLLGWKRQTVRRNGRPVKSWRDATVDEPSQ